MKVQLDSLNSITGWTGTASISQTSWDDIRSSYIPNQMEVLFGSVGGIIAKTFGTPINVKKTDTIGFCICACEPYTNFFIKITSGINSKTYKVPVQKSYASYGFYNPYETIDKIEFISEGLGYYILSDIVAYKDEYPLDISNAIGELFQRTQYDFLPVVGTASVIQDKEYIVISGNQNFIEKHVVIKFGSEVHQIQEIKVVQGGVEVKFTEMYDGKKVLTTFNGDVYLNIPILVNPSERESSAPSISVEGGFERENIPDKTFNVDELIHIDSENNQYYRKEAGFYRYSPVIHGLYRSLETKGIVGYIIEQLSGQTQPIWINGRRHLVKFQEFQDIELEEQFGELQLNCEIELGVYRWKTEIIPVNLTVEIQANPQKEIL